MSYENDSSYCEDRHQPRRRYDDGSDDDRMSGRDRRKNRDKRKERSPIETSDSMLRIEDLFTKHGKSNDALHKSLERTLKAEMGEVKSEVRSLRKEVEANSKTIKEVQSDVKLLEAGHESLKKKVLEMESAPPNATAGHSVERPSHAPRNSFDRNIDTTIFKINTLDRAKVSLENIEIEVQKLLAEKGWAPEIATISGDEMGSNFKVQFDGNISIASGRVSELFKILKVNGKWRKLYTNGPSVETDGGQETQKVQFFCSPDKNPRTIRTEGATKRLAKLIDSMHEGLSLGVRKEDGIIMCGFTKLAKVDVTEDKTKVSWNPKTVDRFKIDQARVSEQFDLKENIQWCS